MMETDGRRGSAAEVSAWEREIDRLVYALYGLTPAEIKLVEESASAGELRRDKSAKK